MNDINFTLEDFIGTYENCVPDEICDKLITHFEKTVSYGLVQLSNGIDHYHREEQIRSDENLNLHRTLILESHGDDTGCVEPMIKYLNTAFKHYIDRHSAAFPHSSSKGFMNRHLKMQKTEPTQGYHVWHSEQGGTGNELIDSRQVVWSLYLNDVEEGGETEFLYQSKRISPKKGCVVLWPAGWTHTHRGNPPLKETKYIVTGWLTEGSIESVNI